MDGPRRSVVKSPAQSYETTIYDRDSGRAFTFVVVPSRSLGEGGGDVPSPEELAGRLGLSQRPARPSRRWPSIGDVSPWALPFAIDIALGNEEDFHGWGPLFLEEHLFGQRGRREVVGPSAFAQYLAYAPVVPFESSALSPKSLSNLATAGGGIGGALGAYVTGDPLLLLTIPTGIIVCGAARGVSQALEIGLRSKILGLMGVEDPEASKAREDKLPPSEPAAE